MSIEEAIQTCDLVPDEDVIRRLLVICDMLNTKICVLENQMRAQNAELARTANVASCLANGIIPD